MTRHVTIDTILPITDQIIANAAAELGQMPLAYGRYVTSLETTGTAQYCHAREGEVIRRNQGRVVLIGRQTNHVSGPRSLGKADGIKNVSVVLREFGRDYLSESCPSGVSIYLDVEGPDPKRGNLSVLSREYWQGWCDGLHEASEGVVILPKCYGIPGDAKTWGALLGQECHGVWLSAPYLAAWAEAQEPARPIQWRDSMMAAYHGEPQIDLWQDRFGDGRHPWDCSLVNPRYADATEFLRTLPLPRAA